MGRPSCSDEEFRSLFTAHGAAETARILGINVRSVYERRSKMEAREGGPIKNPQDKSGRFQAMGGYDKRIHREIRDGVVMVGSDGHLWPDYVPTAFRGMCVVAKKVKPKIVVLNGDILDGARISRHPPIMWQQGDTPTLVQELQAVDSALDELRTAGKGAEFIWTLGNHDARFENVLAQNASQYERVHGTKLRDHFPHWTFAWNLWLNGEVVIKHRYKGGVHATHNNTVNAGKTMVTGHLHSLKVTPFDDYNGTRWGVDSGTLNDPYGPHTAYTEDNPLNHRSGFIVLTFKDGKLLWPEIAAVVDEDHIQFRGEILKV